MRYYLTERMFNIYYLLRLQGGVSGLVRGLVRFIQSYYSLSEQISLAHEIVQAPDGSDLKQARGSHLMSWRVSSKGFPHTRKGICSLSRQLKATRTNSWGSRGGGENRSQGLRTDWIATTLSGLSWLGSLPMQSEAAKRS